MSLPRRLSLNFFTADFFPTSTVDFVEKEGLLMVFLFCVNDIRTLILTFCLFTTAMGHVLASIFEVKNSMDVAQSLASKGKLNDREMLHFNAAKALAGG